MGQVEIGALKQSEKVIMKYILMLALVFPIYFWGTCAEAFQNEPGGFRGIKWEEPFKNYSKEMIFKYASEKDSRIKFYTRRNDKKQFKGIEVIETTYGFYNGAFLHANIKLKFKYRKEARKALVSMFGKLTKKTERNDCILKYGRSREAREACSRLIDLGPDSYLRYGKISSVALTCGEDYDCYVVFKSKYVERSAWVYRYIKGTSQLTKSDKQRIATLEKVVKKYSKVIGACGIEFIGTDGQVIHEYQMPNRKAFPSHYFFMELIQITDDGWAIYDQYEIDTSYIPSMQFLVAVKRSSVKGNLRRGARLLSHTKCLGRLKDTTVKNARGFPVRVRRYEAIYP